MSETNARTHEVTADDVLAYLQRHKLNAAIAVFERDHHRNPRRGAAAAAQGNGQTPTSTSSDDVPVAKDRHGHQQHSKGATNLKAPPSNSNNTPASPTPAKPVPAGGRVPPMEGQADGSGERPKSASQRKQSEDATAAAADANDGDDDDDAEDAIELWDPRDLGVISVPGTESDIWHLDPTTNIAPEFPAGGGVTYRTFTRLCNQMPQVPRVPTRPYQKSPPPSDLPLESFDLRVIYEAGRTGFEDVKDFPIPPGTVIAGRYQVTEYLGSAAFSRAVQCVDLKHNAQVCVKIIRNNKDFFDQSLDEVKLLLHINSNGDADSNHVLQLYDYFYYKEHMFLVCELLRDNLYEFAKFNRDQEPEPYFNLSRARLVAKQVLTALKYIHSLGLLHCDLKPENILIKSYSRCIIKVIDFGSSCFTTDSLSSYVQSRCYRAPEVVLGCPYDGGIDVWSLGAILPELLTGHVLFHNDTLAQMLARIAAICGPFPESVLHRGRHTSCFVTEHGAFYEYPVTDIDGQKIEGELTFHFPRPTTLEHLAGDGDPDYVDFLRQCLTVDPTKRPSAAALLQHPFIIAADKHESPTDPVSSPSGAGTVAGATSPRK